MLQQQYAQLLTHNQIVMDTYIEIEKDRGGTEAISHCLKRVTFELADLQRRSQLSVGLVRRGCGILYCYIIFIPYCTDITFCWLFFSHC